jgi:hypothetical protein
MSETSGRDGRGRVPNRGGAWPMPTGDEWEPAVSGEWRITSTRGWGSAAEGDDGSTTARGDWGQDDWQPAADGNWDADTASWRPATANWAPAAATRGPAAGRQRPTARSQDHTTGNLGPSAGTRDPAAGRQRPAVRRQDDTTGNWGGSPRSRGQTTGSWRAPVRPGYREPPDSPEYWGPPDSRGDWGPPESAGYRGQAVQEDWGSADSEDRWGPEVAPSRGPSTPRAGGIRERRAGQDTGERTGPAKNRPSTKSGAAILVIASLVAGVAATVLLVYYSGQDARQQAQDSVVMAPVTDLGTLASQYAAIAAPVNKQLATEIGNYDASQNSDLAAARSALDAEVTTERSFDARLATWLSAWKNDYGTATSLQSSSESNGVTVTIPYPSSVTATAQKLLKADQASESLIAQQAQAGTLPGMQSFNGRHQAANAAVEAQATLLRKDLQLPPA